MAEISIIGSGWVGTAIGLGLAQLGNTVIFYDVVEKKGLPNFSRDINYAITNSDVSFICVPTPTNAEGSIDLSYIQDAAKNVGRALADKERYHVIVVKSTVVPGTTEEVVTPIVERSSGKRVRRGEIGMCMNPEFLTEISGSWSTEEGMKKDFFSEDRIVIGAYDSKAGDALEALYKPLNKPIFRTDLKTAEMIKYASNCMLATKISYWNEIFLICDALGIASQVVADIVARDPRIGRYGTIHGKAFGGKCLPKDLKAFIAFARSHAQEAKVLKAVDELNELMKEKYGVRE
ncbi:MAG: UDP-glucose/GDP-mannose dehydrogenase family protein [Methanophagales archaeon ANME-1-THS]|nr:MAG: UDP-glucose/GDP-mannose dehydrogenase family protein [Methanophagales archaeon ANME-1-THS]